MTASCIETISISDLAALRREHANLPLIDVRTAGEFETQHAVGAQSIPLQGLDAARVRALQSEPDAPVYIICKSGGRSAQAAQLLAAAGMKHAVSVEGGTDAWVAAGLPVERGERNVLPLDRQMRTVAGVFIFLGALLALVANPLFAIIPVLMGLGLSYSGVTGHCPLSDFIARMPWNRGSKSCCCAGK